MRLVQELDEHWHWLLEVGRRHCCLLAKHSEAASLSTEKVPNAVVGLAGRTCRESAEGDKRFFKNHV